MKLRVFFDRVRIMDDRDPKVEPLRLREAKPRVVPADTRLTLGALVRTDNYGGVEQKTRLPREGHYTPKSLYSIRIEQSIFEGDVEDHLNIRVDVLPPDAGRDQAVDTYEREFTGDPQSWLGKHAPDQASGPENLGWWELYYRIEPAEESADG
ncbi:MAG TPA: hypothetical protein VHF25_08605 [Nitriliruptorales bacterium]|nr:hypothetical protein [Nitriliruptorales bacterium]